MGLTMESVRKKRKKSPLCTSKDVLGNAFPALALPAYIRQQIHAAFHFPQHFLPELDYPQAFTHLLSAPLLQ